MIIRKLKPEELVRLADWGPAFLEEHGQGPFERERAIRWWMNIMRNASGVVFVAEHEGEFTGAMSAFLCPDPYRMGLLAQGGFWYVRPEYRHTRTAVGLFRAFEEWALDNHVDEIRVGHMLGAHRASIRNYFLTSGYHPFENIYAKRTNHECDVCRGERG